MRAPTLVPASDVETRDGRLFATSAWPWLKCEFASPTIAAGWVRLTYAAGFREPSARPVLRARVGDAVRDQLMPAATLGRAIWTGRIPEGAREIWISPVNQPGPFAFRLERWETISRPALLAGIVAADPWRAAKCVWGRLAGHAEFARLQARRALGPTEMTHYDAWRRARARDWEPDGLDASTSDDDEGPRFRVVARGGDLEAWRRQLQAQPYPRWSVTLWGHDPDTALAAGLADDDFLLFLGAGDRLALPALPRLRRRRGEPRRPTSFTATKTGSTRRGVTTGPC